MHHAPTRLATPKRIVLTAVSAVGIGLMLLLYGMLADPFSIPFQDFDLMLAAQQAEYSTQAARAEVLRRVGIVLVAVGVLLGMFVIGQRVRRASQ
ncbi:MAG: hypothetical protein HC828_21115 [Blastochloris sp.]|nr:hypothetical protein [Blastochloris sp.]